MIISLVAIFVRAQDFFRMRRLCIEEQLHVVSEYDFISYDKFKCSQNLLRTNP